MKRKISYTALLLFIFQIASFAQCAMCKTTAESDLQNGGSFGKGLNTGILFLIAVPYIILLLGAYLFFKKSVDAKLKNWRIKFFPAK